MDGHFVPNLTIGPPVVAAIRRHTDAYLDCHLMMTNPGDYLEAFAAGGRQPAAPSTSRSDGTAELIDAMRRLGLDAGLAVNPETAVRGLRALAGRDRPGPGDVRASRLRRSALHAGGHAEDRPGRRAGPPATVSTWPSRSTAASTPTPWCRSAEAGADTFVAGSAIFGHPDPGRPRPEPSERRPRPRCGRRAPIERRPVTAGPSSGQGGHRVRRGDGRHPRGPLRRGAGGGRSRRPDSRSSSGR